MHEFVMVWYVALGTGDELMVCHETAPAGCQAGAVITVWRSCRRLILLTRYNWFLDENVWN